MNFYTNCVQFKNKLYLSGYKDGKRYRQQIDYKPYMFFPAVPNAENTRYKNIHGEPVERKNFDSIFDCRNFIKKYEDVDGFSIYGLTQHQYVYIYDNFKNMKYDTSLIKTVVLDIEVSTDGGYPDIDSADKEITAITLMYDDITFVFAYVDFKNDDPSIKYFKCKDEADLLNKFLKIMSFDGYRPDVITGWNIELFDIPYIVNRLVRVMGDDAAKKLSPWNILEGKQFESFGKINTAYLPLGVNILDYYQLYRKFTYVQQESYKLDHICEVELGEKKIDYSEYGSLNELYKKNPQLYIEYNIQDCRLVRKLDDKMKLLDLVYQFAYDSGTNYIDALTSVRSWDVIIHNHLMNRKVVIAQKKYNVQSFGRPIGAHVKDPLQGMYDWVVSFDLTSLYPHLIIGYNISPDTYRGQLPNPISLENLLDGKSKDILDKLKDNNLTLAANNCLYTKDFKGFLPELMEDLFNKRKEYKKNMLQLIEENEKNPSTELKNKIAMYNNLQMAAKIKLNSAYGALANEGFRWFDKKYAESITLSGQLTILWAEKHLNAYINSLVGTSDIDYVIASDTDSVYINMSSVVKKSGLTDKQKIIAFLDKLCEKKIQEHLNSIYSELAEMMNCYTQAMHMKRESISDRALFIAKKRYIVNVWNNEGVQYNTPKLKMMGIEAVRSSTPAACRESIKKAIEIILNDGEDATIEYIDAFRNKFKTMTFEQIAFPRGLNGLDDYRDSVTIYKKATPIHVRGALLYNKLLKDRNLEMKYNPIVNKDKIKFCYLKVPNPIQENVIAVSQFLPKELNLDKYIDYDLQFEKSFVEPIKTILDVIGWELEKKVKVSAFFE